MPIINSLEIASVLGRQAIILNILELFWSLLLLSPGFTSLAISSPANKTHAVSEEIGYFFFKRVNEVLLFLVGLVGFEFIRGYLVRRLANTEALGDMADVHVLYVEDVLPLVAVAGVGAQEGVVGLAS